MILKGTCKKCGSVIKLDIGDRSVREVVELLKKQDTFICPGHHVELCPPYPAFWEVDTWELEEGSVPN